MQLAAYLKIDMYCMRYTFRKLNCENTRKKRVLPRHERDERERDRVTDNQ